MYPSVLLSSLSVPFTDALREAVALGFAYVDVVALTERPAAHLAALADSGLLVACAALGKGLPADQTLDAPEVSTRRTALEQMQRQLSDAARLGATHAYIVSGCDGSAQGLARFTEACALLAEFAAQHRIRLCVEPIPGRALASATAVLEWLDRLNHPQLALLVDIGHCLISREDPAAVVRRAGSRVGYVHLDDNDGINDVHWPLLTGCLTQTTLTAFLTALRETGYEGGLALELHPQSPPEALGQGKALVERWCATVR